MTSILVFLDPTMDTYDYNRIVDGINRTAITSHCGGMFDADWTVTYGKAENGDIDYDAFSLRMIGTDQHLTVREPEHVAVAIDGHWRGIFQTTDAA